MAEFGFQKRIPAMLPSDFESITQLCLSVFRDALQASTSQVAALSALALEGALKLKEIRYIRAESHPVGELKHALSP